MGVPGGPKRYYHMGEVGGIAFGVRGEFSTRAVPVQSSDPGQANVTFTMGFPGNSNGVAPSQNFAGQPAGKGIPDGGSGCFGSFRWAGFGNGYGKLYDAEAFCDIDYQGNVGIFASGNKSFGAESWFPANLQVGSATAVGNVTGGDIYSTNQKAVSGMRYACFDTSGHLVSSVKPCSGS